MVLRSEGGLRNHRTEYIRESTTGTAPSDPAWNLFSDTVRSLEWSPDAQIEEQRGLGDAAPNGFFRGPETHELTITYDLQQGVESGGSPQDASADGLERDSDQLLKNTHTLVDREDKTSLDSEETVNESTSYDTRIYTVGKGGYVDEVVFTGDPGSQQPVQVELTYQFEKIRSYQIDQPSSATGLALESTDSSDTGLTVTIENEDAGKSEDVSLDGSDATTLVGSTTTDFADIDAIELGSEATGDIKVYINDGSTSTPTKGDQLATIPGQSTYNSIEGDLGVPALGSGSHASALGSSYEIFLGDTIERPSGTSTWAYDISSYEMTVSNNLETSVRSDSMRQRISIGQQDSEVSATLMGETESHSQIIEHLQGTTNDIVWTLDNSILQLDSAVLMDAPSRTIEAGQAMLSLDCGFTGSGITVT